MIEAIPFYRLGESLPSMLELRKKVFVDRLGWQLDHYEGMEMDEYDTLRSVYLVGRDHTDVRACARLNSTASPFLTQQIWPEVAIDSQDDRWEVSRFAIDPDFPEAMRDKLFGELFVAFAEYGLRRGIREYIFVTPRALVERGLGAAGVDYDVLGQTKRFGRLPVIAARAYVTHTALHRLRKHHSNSLVSV